MWVGFVSRKGLAFSSSAAAPQWEAGEGSWWWWNAKPFLKQYFLSLRYWVRALLPRMKAPQSQLRIRGSTSPAVMLSSKVWVGLIKERTAGAGSWAATCNSTTGLHYLSVHSAPFNLFFNGVPPRNQQEHGLQYRFLPQGPAGSEFIFNISYGPR